MVQLVLSVQASHGYAKFWVLSMWLHRRELFCEMFRDGGWFGAGFDSSVLVGEADGLVRGYAGAFAR